MQGDVIEIYNTSGSLVMGITYDAWGNFTDTISSQDVVPTTEQAIALGLPFRYRSYYYDSETGFYYLNSRYYDPQIRRFISADNIDVINASPTELTDKNLYAYCDNNPIMRIDDGGEFWNFVIGAAVGAIIGGITAAISSYQSTGEVNVGAVLIGAGAGAIGGLVGASGLGCVTQAAISGVVSFAANVGTQLTEGKTFATVDYMDALIDGGISAGCSFIGSVSTKKLAASAKGNIEKGLKRISSGMNKYNNGSRYYKGSLKRGIDLLNKGAKALNVARGSASVIGSVSNGLGSSIKMVIQNALWG